MKLYLSSYRVPTPDDLFELLPSKPELTSTAMIINAKDDGRPEKERRQKIESARDYMVSLGLLVTPIDLKNYANQSELGRDLSNFPLIYALGGNTFALRERMRLSGLDLILPELLAAGTVYFGESAGAIVVGPTLNGFGSMDDPLNLNEDMKGVGLIDKILVPHNDSSDLKYNGRSRHIIKVNPGQEVVALNDNQAYIVNGLNSKIVTGV